MTSQIDIIFKEISLPFLLRKMKQLPAGQEKLSFCEFHNQDILIAGAVYGLGDGFIQVIRQPTSILIDIVKSIPSFPGYLEARKQQCKWYRDAWLNDVSGQRGFRIVNRYTKTLKNSPLSSVVRGGWRNTTPFELREGVHTVPLKTK